MIEEVFLRTLGFTEFIHLRKSERDGRQRLTCTVVYNNALLTILLLKQHNHWIIDKLIFDEGNSARNELSWEMGLEALITKVFTKELVDAARTRSQGLTD